MVLPLVRPGGVVRDFIEASDVLNAQHIDRSAAGPMYIGYTNTAGQTIYLGTPTTTIEIAGTLTLLDSSTLIANSGSISLGDGDGDVITLGGGGAGDIVNIGSTSADTINVNSDLLLAANVGAHFTRSGSDSSTAQMLLPDTVDGSGAAGAIRVNMANALQWWNGASWSTAGTANPTLDQAYNNGPLLTIDAAGGDLQFEITQSAAAKFRITTTNPAESDFWDFTSPASDQLSATAVLQDFGLTLGGGFIASAVSNSSLSASAGTLTLTGVSGLYLSDGIATLLLDGSGNFNESGLVSFALTPIGAINMIGGAASQLVTSAGALTLTSAVTAVWSTLAGSLTLQAATVLSLDAVASQLNFSDGFRSASTYGSFMPFSSNTAEWNAFVTNFGNGVSVLASINKAYENGFGFDAICTAGISAGHALGGSTTDNEVDPADADSLNPEEAVCLGFAAATVGAGIRVSVLTNGEETVYSNAVETWTRGDLIYLDVNAGKVTNAPSPTPGSGDTVQIVGKASATDGAPSLSHAMWIMITIPTYA